MYNVQSTLYIADVLDKEKTINVNRPKLSIQIGLSQNKIPKKQFVLNLCSLSYDS